ncbi:UNVERIFIED_CONTAM: hypothetical protein Scaly_3000000 [Sesamum calycinum]|uniref:Uncharacterized protein n=1 Tax=Sesamum calycinum TaxID=2727403 RepID=A0AAW2KEA7_9LAMI
MRTAWDGGVKDLDVYTDSELVAMQIEAIVQNKIMVCGAIPEKGTLPSDPGAAKRLMFRANRWKNLAQKVLRQGYFYPTMVKDEKEFSKKCESCQKFATTSHVSATPMEPDKITYPFDQWGINIVGLFQLAAAEKKFMIMAVEYFSKWVEATALARISEK